MNLCKIPNLDAAKMQLITEDFADALNLQKILHIDAKAYKPVQ
jgi:hypothetical protein